METAVYPNPMTLPRVAELFEKTRTEVAKVIVGQERLVEGVVVALFSEGSVLLEGPPGLGKTLLVNVLARTFTRSVFPSPGGPSRRTLPSEKRATTTPSTRRS